MALRVVAMAYTVLAADFVSMEDGTGIVHIAPAFGGEDFDMGKEHGLLFLQPVDLRGSLPEGSPWPGQFVKEADSGIIDDLDAARPPAAQRDHPPHLPVLLALRHAAALLRQAHVVHPHHRRQGQAHRRQRAINWYPDHIKHGRFGDWLRNNVDWALSRERYWGTPLPIWQCASCSTYDARRFARGACASGAATRRAADALDDLHRPYIDRIELRCLECGGAMRRVPELMDVWFDSGAMPYAQWHYPFENTEHFQPHVPRRLHLRSRRPDARLVLHAARRGRPAQRNGEAPESLAYRNVICLGHILDDKGRKMSKSLGNVVEPMSVIEQHGADALRWYLFTATRPGEPRRFSDKLVSESLRRFLLTLWNTYSFFVTYANLDGFDPTTAAERRALRARPLGALGAERARPARSRATSTQYDPTTSGRAIQDFVDDLSNWYVRRSRRRFWKPASTTPISWPPTTRCTRRLVTVAKLLAPFTPFVAEAIYQNLVRSVDGAAPESVHLAEWPEADESLRRPAA